MKIVIWGAGKIGEQTFQQVKQYNMMDVVAFGDNDVEKHNSYCCGKKVYGISQIKDMGENIDGVIIASVHYEEIYTQIKDALKVPVYKNIGVFLGRRASIEISGWCNAKCKWCATGIKNRSHICVDRKYMTFEKFKIIYEHLINSSIFHQFNELLLYSWGEPFLNPDCMKILEYLYEQKQVFSISTNASVLSLATKKSMYKMCRTVVFSMPGFSQTSYEKIHGFNFEVIRENVKKIINNMRECGFKGEGILSYHVYQFNLNEIHLAENFAKNLGLKFVPVYAYFASYDLTKKYLTNNLSHEQLKEAEKDLLLSHVDELLMKRPVNYNCAVENMISINAKGNLELCCCCDDGIKDYEWGNILDVATFFEWEQIRKEMMLCSTCQECKALGIDYWFTNNPRFTD